jgi:acetyl esterase/lipase
MCPRVAPHRWLTALGAALLLAGIAVGCENIEPTPTPSATPPILAASATIVPRLPTAVVLIDGADPNIVGFTPAAVPAVNGATITPTPLPTQASLDLQFTTADGLLISATYAGAAQRPAPTVILLHMYGSNKEAWGTLPAQLQAAGYNAIAIDLRGHGATGGVQEWAKAQQDVVRVMQQVASLPGVRTEQISLIGASIGANLAVNACATLGTCRTLVLLSPGLDYLGVTTADSMARLSRPVLIIASQDDAPSNSDSARLNGLGDGERRLLLNAGQAHGTVLLTTQPTLGETIIQWLRTH